MAQSGEFAKRAFDVLAALVGLVTLSSIFLAITISVRLDSSGPAIFSQERVGRGGRRFRLYKFRTMRVGADRESRLTPDGDARVTRIGAFLRRTNLDELPQLLNVLMGDMSLVGPRPEVPEFVDLANPLWCVALSVRPGMTAPVTVEFRREGEILARYADPSSAYRREILPVKLARYAEYAEHRTFFGDVKTILSTIWSIVGGPSRVGQA